MYLLRRAAVRTALLQPTRQLSTLRTSSTRVTLAQSAKPTLYRPFHQTRIWRADEDERRPEASPADAQTTGETVPIESLEEAAATEPFEQEGVVEEFKEEAIAAAEVAADAAEAAEEAADAAYDAELRTDSSPAATEDLSPESTGGAVDVAAAAAETAQTAATSAAAAAQVAPEFRQRPRRQDFNSAPSNTGARQTAPPSRILYVGNLFFEVTAQQLETEFAKFGQITNSRVVTDSRGLSKGFAYIEFADQEAADRAVQESDQKVFSGRRMAVQYHVRREPRRAYGNQGGSREPAPPSKTLFIGNMSYQMSDRDLNDLFREIRDVLDVRVAIDRRSGQPRGFAHADFIDVPAAQRAKEVLEKKVVYGRQLRIDYSANSSSTRQST